MISIARLACACLSFAAACGGAAATRVASPASGCTGFDHEGLTFTLPGAWREAPGEGGGWELHRDKGQVMVSFYPLAEGLDAAASAEKLSAIQIDSFRGV